MGSKIHKKFGWEKILCVFFGLSEKTISKSNTQRNLVDFPARWRKNAEQKKFLCVFVGLVGKCCLNQNPRRNFFADRPAWPAGLADSFFPVGWSGQPGWPGAGLAWPGLAWLGLAWFDLSLLGFAWLGLA